MSTENTDGPEGEEPEAVPNQHVLMVGDPVSGVHLHGPFPDIDGAISAGEGEFPNETWWVVEVEHMSKEGA